MVIIGRNIKIARFFQTKRWWVREFLAEFLGTAFFILAGSGAVAQMKLRAGPVVNHGFTDFLSVNIGYALAIAFGVYISIGVSGGHLNPAVTLTMCIFGKSSWSRLPVYWLAQYLGAFIGSLVIYVTYIDSIKALEKSALASDNGVVEMAGIFATFPAAHMRQMPAFLDELVGTAILLLVIFALIDKRNAAVPKCLIPLLVGLLIVMIGTCYGIQVGYAINPARDLAPRIFAMIAWGEEVFQRGNDHFRYFFWIPVVAPHLGAILGAAIYEGFIGVQFQSADTDEHTALVSAAHHHDDEHDHHYRHDDVENGGGHTVLQHTVPVLTSSLPARSPECFSPVVTPTLGELGKRGQSNRSSYERLHNNPALRI